MARLILINGPPAIGKSTLARRYGDDHPLTLVLDIDAIRTLLGQWQQINQSKLLARKLALAMAGFHLQQGHDVVVPQLATDTNFIDMLAGVASAAGADFVEVMMISTLDEAAARLRTRLADLAASDEPHPLQVDPVSERDLAGTLQTLRTVAAARPQTRLVTTYEDLLAALRTASQPGT